MEDSEFDNALVAAALAIAGRDGWSRVSVAAAATEAGLSLGRARARFPVRAMVLLRLGVIADQAALAALSTEASVRDKLFDMIMRRLDVLQANRTGVLALMRAVPADPPLGLLLALSTKRSLRWLLEAAGERSHGLRGELKLRGLLAVWLYTLHAWRSDASADMAATMAALDRALGQAERAAGWLAGHRGTTRAAEAPPPAVDEFPPDTPATAPTVL
jgi:ubiquinone biosynthesis protein COQ9